MPPPPLPILPDPASLAGSIGMARGAFNRLSSALLIEKFDQGLPAMQLELLETFLDLAETRSFHRTAERLGITQSTVSTRIRSLEALLGRPLLRRSRAGSELTPEGLRFEPHARALRRDWAEAVAAVQAGGPEGQALRIAYQHDLSGGTMGEGQSGAGRWIAEIRALMPAARIYIEADYSNQMCADLVAGALDLALLFTPKPHPDLHFETLGEIGYVMISTEAGRLTEVAPQRYILANYSPAFAAAHSALLPELSVAPVSSGQSSVVADLLAALGGTAYLRRETALRLCTEGRARRVVDPPEIPQPVFAATHLRNRHRGIYRRLISRLRASFG
jgi:DNA-binding transcriptional LysR family regulator